jgi:hypothetical protein
MLAAEYMTLPASQYSVLDAKKIERIDDDTFRCYVGGLHLFSFVVEPVLTVSVVVGERGPTVKLLETKVRALSFLKRCYLLLVEKKIHPAISINRFLQQ